MFLQLLETRLDNVLYRLGIAYTRRQARQFISHGHITVNGSKSDIPSYRTEPGDVIAVAEKSRDNPIIRSNIEETRRRKGSPWLEFDPDTMTGRVSRLPSREDITVPVNELLVIEYYSR